jgi:hypothetical protein
MERRIMLGPCRYVVQERNDTLVPNGHAFGLACGATCINNTNLKLEP